MNLESVIENDEQKIIFLKAIILGINYGKTDNADVYRHNILNEIKKLSEKINVNKKSLNNSLEKNKNVLESNISFQKEGHYESTEKYDTNILNLEKQKTYTINLINNLTASNYQYNYSKINLLKSNLINIDKEIEKNKINILKYKGKNNIKSNQRLSGEINTMIPTKNMMNEDSKENFVKIMTKNDKFNEENQQNIQNIQNQQNQQNIEENIENKNLSGELEKTLSSLTNLLL